MEKMNNKIDKKLKEGGKAIFCEALIKLSGKNADSLAVHWMVFSGIIKVVKVLEKDKDKDKDNDASIGSILKIKNKIYNSFDELLARYISPRNERIEEADSSVWQPVDYGRNTNMKRITSLICNIYEKTL